MSSEEEEEQEEYVVEAIRGWRYHLRMEIMQYFIKWLNYPEKENTWEPEDNLNCPKILEDYKESLEGKQKRYFLYEPKRKLSGFQRNATFTGCVGADQGHRKDDKYPFYVLVTFEDSDYAEEVTLEEFYEYEPKKAFNFVEQRLLWRDNGLGSSNSNGEDRERKKKKKEHHQQQQ